MAEVKPCPFCGGEAWSYFIPSHKHCFVNMPDYDGSGFVECRKCSAAIVAETEEKAIELWNTRTPKERGVDNV